MKTILKLTAIGIILLAILGLQAFGQEKQPQPATAAILNAGTDNSRYATALSLAGWTGGGGTSGGLTTNTAAYVVPGLPLPYMLLSADQFATNPIGTTITGTWKDLMGNNNFTVTAATVNPYGVYGKPSLLGNGSTTIGDSVNVLPASLNTNFTYELKFQDPAQAVNQVILSCSNAGTSIAYFIQPWGQAVGASAGGGSFITGCQTNTFSQQNSIWKNYVSHTVIERYNGTNVDIWLDGTKGTGSFYALNAINGIGFNGNISLWNTQAGGFAWPGNIRQLTIWTNVLTDAQVNNQLQFDKIVDQGIPVNTIHLIGTSITYGWAASPGGDLTKLLAALYPGWRIDPSGISGSSSTTDLLNLTNNITPKASNGKDIYVVETFGINDLKGFTYAQAVPTGIATVESNLIYAANAIHTNGGQIIVWPPLSTSVETNGWVTNITQWLNANAGVYFDGYAGNMTNAAFCQPGAFANSTYFLQENPVLHPTTATYTAMVNTYLSPVINQLIIGSGGVTQISSNSVSAGQALQVQGGLTVNGPQTNNGTFGASGYLTASKGLNLLYAGNTGYPANALNTFNIDPAVGSGTASADVTYLVNCCGTVIFQVGASTSPANVMTMNATNITAPIFNATGYQMSSNVWSAAVITSITNGVSNFGWSFGISNTCPVGIFSSNAINYIWYTTPKITSP